MEQRNRPTYSEHRIGIRFAGKYQEAVLCVDDSLPWEDRVWIHRIGVSRSPIKLYPGKPLIVLTGSRRALEITKQHGYPVADTDEKLEQFSRIIG